MHPPREPAGQHADEQSLECRANHDSDNAGRRLGRRHEGAEPIEDPQEPTEHHSENWLVHRSIASNGSITGRSRFVYGGRKLALGGRRWAGPGTGDWGLGTADWDRHWPLALGSVAPAASRTRPGTRGTREPWNPHLRTLEPAEPFEPTSVLGFHLTSPQQPPPPPS